MKNSAFAISAEAFLSLFLLFLLFLAFSQPFSRVSLEELYLLQKANDLLKVWSLKQDFSSKELVSDIEFVFSENCVILKIDDSELNNCKRTEKFFTTSAKVFDKSLSRKSIELTVYY